MGTPQLAKLEQAIRDVLGATFDDGFRALFEHEKWYSPSISVSELFEHWVIDRLATATDHIWVFECVRAHERRLVCDNVGVDRGTLVGRSPRDAAEAVLKAVGLPSSRQKSASDIAEAIQALANGQETDDARIAVNARQRGERCLRVLLYFYVHTGGVDDFVGLLADPGSLRLPKRLEAIIKGAEKPTRDLICKALTEDGWADLGFLALATRKLSKRFEDAHVIGIGGNPIRILTADEAQAFQNLSTALQAYAHDKPSQDQQKWEQLQSALKSLSNAFNAMVAREVFPEELLVTEVCESILGPIVHAMDSNSLRISLSVSEKPTVGQRIFAIRSCARPYARSTWAPCPW